MASIVPQGNVSDVEASIKNNVIKCVFVSSNPISTQRAAVSSPTYYLLYAYGPSSNGKDTPDVQIPSPSSCERSLSCA